MDDQNFQKHADATLTKLFDLLMEAGDDYGFEPDFNAGALTIEFETPPGKFVVSPNSPVKQIWVSANVKSFKLDWDESRQAFVLPASGQDLNALVEEAIGTHLGRGVNL